VECCFIKNIVITQKSSVYIHVLQMQEITAKLAIRRTSGSELQALFYLEYLMSLLQHRFSKITQVIYKQKVSKGLRDRKAFLNSTECNLRCCKKFVSLLNVLDFPKNHHAFPFYKDLSNETTFSLIHLSGQYLSMDSVTISLTSSFFHKSGFPQPKSIPLGPFQFF
jgi:hypothetical protein